MIALTISEKGGQQSRLEFNKAEITIGRMKGNDIVLPRGNISKRHAAIRSRDGSFFINDYGSTNGTYVNGRKVNNELQLADSDKVFIGDFIIQLDYEVSRNQAPASDASADGYNAQGNEVSGGRKDGSFETLFDPNAGQEGSLRSTHTQPPEDGSENPEVTFGEPSPNYDPLRSTMAVGGEDGRDGRFDVDSLNIPEGESPAAVGAASQTGNLETGGQELQQSAIAPSFTSLTQAPEVHSEFDPDFFVAQLDMVRVMLEKIPFQDLPRNYPPTEQDRDTYRSLIQEIIQNVKPDVDTDLLENLLVAESTGLGPLDLYLDDFDIRDIYINKYDQILIRKNGQLFQSRYVYSSPDFLRLAAERLLGEEIAHQVGADEIRFGDGTRVHIVMPPVAVDGPLITIRKPPAEHSDLTELIQHGVLSAGMADFLMRAVDASRSIVIAGPTSSGKTTLLSALAGLIPDGMRVIAVEDYSHIDLPQGSAVRLEANPGAGYDKDFLLKSAVSMHPQRILLDECRGSEAHQFVTAVASGTDGSMMTIHGMSANDALGRLSSLCLMGGAQMSPRGLREQIARAVHLVVVVNRTSDESFRIQQITEVQGVDLDSFRLNDIFYFRVEGASGAFHPTGYIPLFYEDLRHAGIDVDFDIFRE